jgi:HD superfamily phosphodiesterase
MKLFSQLFNFVLLMTNKYGIDDSHGVSHSMNVFHFATMIYNDEVRNYPILKEQHRIVTTSAILHDVCDKKYMDEREGLKQVEKFLKEETDLTPNEINISCEIMATMSYSKVKNVGFPNLGGYQKAYHIVREADLLAAYDFDRCLIYNMNRNYCNIEQAFEVSTGLFNNRVFRHKEDNLFLLDYSKTESLKLQSQSLKRIHFWKNVLKK